jgi:putative ABC transport system permease protein
MGWIRRLRNTVLGSDVDTTFDDEARFHLEQRIEDGVKSGMSYEEAEAEARRRLGNLTLARERIRDVDTLSWLTDVGHDVRYATRMLRRTPGFAFAGVLTLALGMGASAAMFSVINRVLLHPLPYVESHRLLQVVQRGGAPTVSIPEFTVVREHVQTFSSVAAYRASGERRLTYADGQDWVATMAVSTDFLRTLGVTLVSGREFVGDEIRTGGVRSVILTAAVWQHLGADPGILGKAVILDETAYTVVGILPASFWFPDRMDVLIPMQPTGGLEDLGTNTRLVARLKSDVTLQQAQAELAALAEALKQARIANGGAAPPNYRGVTAIGLQDALVGTVRVNLLLLFGATAVLLLIACVNLAMLLTSRLAARRKELALRLALGSGHGRLFRQFLVDQLVLVAFGTVASIAMASCLVQGLLALAPFSLPAAGPIRLDIEVIGFTLTIAILTALVFTGFALFITRRLDLRDALNGGSRAFGQQTHRNTRNLLVVTEVALSTTLLVAALLLVRSLYELQQVQLGFTPAGLITFVTPFDRSGSASVDRSSLVNMLRQRLEGVPGVQAVAITTVLPLAGRSNLPTEHVGHPDQSIGGMEVRSVTANYFNTMGIPLRRGRHFSSADATGSPVVAIGATVARAWWPGADAIGDRLIIGSYQGHRFGNDSPREIVAIVGDTKSETLSRPPSPTIYVPLEQALFGSSSVSWIVKADKASRVAGLVRAAVRDIAPNQRVLSFQTMDQVVASSTAASRFNALLFAIFAGVALALATVGLYGVLTFLVTQRRQEIGVRLALGASRSAVVRQVLVQGLGLTLGGLGLGLAAALPLTTSLSALLYSVRPNDPTTFIVVSLALLVVGVAASALPASRAAGVDPITALRMN